MGYENLEELVRSEGDIVETFRGIDLERSVYSPAKRGSFPDEDTNWIEEQRALRESCVVVDQSHHMMSLHVEGPDAMELFSDLGANGFEDFRSGSPPQAKQLVQCSPDGYSIRDVVLFYLDEGYFLSVGSPVGNNWIAFNAETGDYDASIERPIYSPIGDYEPIGDGDVLPPDFRFQVQGPDARDLVASVTDGPLPDIPFFGVREVTVDGRDVYALSHGMAEAPGLELFGPYDHHDEVHELLLEAGQEYDVRRLGSMAYKTGKVGSGWIKLPVPGIYESEALEGYRRWLGTDTIEARMSIGGSYRSDDITDYYMTPVELGYGRHVDLDHDFVGREAVREQIEDPERRKVTFVWNDEDVVDVYASLFREGDTGKFVDLPDVANRWSKTHYDRVLKDGEVVGISKYPGYLYYERSLLSLGVVDTEYSEPGTEVTFVWGEEDSPKSRVERHVETEIRATVAPCPYTRRGRRDP